MSKHNKEMKFLKILTLSHFGHLTSPVLGKRLVSTSTSTNPAIPKGVKGLAADVTKLFGRMIEDKVKAINGLLGRNAGRGLVNYFLQ